METKMGIDARIHFSETPDNVNSQDTAVNPDELWQPLARLDQLLKKAVILARAVYGPEAAADPFRGLHISDDEVNRLVEKESGTPMLNSDDEVVWELLAEAIDPNSRLAWLQQAFDLSAFDIAVILIALAPEVDLGYERVYAFLQNDVSKKRPTVDLALNLLCASKQMKVTRTMHFATGGVLLEHRLLHLLPDPQQAQSPLLAHYLKLDDQIINLLLDQQVLDGRLKSVCRLIQPMVAIEQVILDTDKKQRLLSLVIRASTESSPLRLYFHGPVGTGIRQTAEALAFEAGLSLLVVDLPGAIELCPGRDFDELLQLIFREAWLQDAMLYIEHIEAVCEKGNGRPFDSLIREVAELPGIAVLAGQSGWPPVELPEDTTPIGILEIPFGMPDFTDRLKCWKTHLSAVDVTLDSGNLNNLASRFRLTQSQVAKAVATGCCRAEWQEAGAENTGPSAVNPSTVNKVQPTVSDLFAAARAQSDHALAQLAAKIQPRYVWEDIVLPDDTVSQLREIGQRVAFGPKVLGDWGFDRKLSLGKGISVLFAGFSGTGKTMAAEVIANELGLDLYKIDLSRVVSKWIGETEKNLEQIFSAAENANAILFFDEADALFGRRSEVHDSHDRYANVEISYLLQKMEEYEGIAILATNLKQNMDEGFVRRLAFTVHFLFPEELDRRKIWAGIWPRETPLADDLNLDFLAGEFKLSGGNIKNIALAAAFLAAADNGVVTMEYLSRALQREYQKMGRTLSEGELNDSAGVMHGD